MKELIKPEEIIINGVSLKELLKNHKKWLNNEENGEQLILKNADLKNADLEGINLEGADLEKADLENANLIGTDLSYANLIGVNLEGADLENADLTYADLRYVNLKNANLKKAKLHSTKLYRTKRKDLFEIGNIGNKNNIAYYFVESNRVICDFFNDSLEEFINKVKDTYEKDTREYMEYMFAIDTFKKYKEMYHKIQKL